MVEADGADALTMRSLANELDVATTTIYWHVGNRAELITALVRRHGARLAEAPVEGDTARDRVLAVARLIWESAITHREITRLASAHGAASTPVDGPAGQAESHRLRLRQLTVGADQVPVPAGLQVGVGRQVGRND